MIKTCNKWGIEGDFLILIKDIYETTASLRLNVEGLKTFPLRLRGRQGYLFMSPLFNIVLEVVAREIGQEKEIIGIYIGKEVKWSQFQMT